MKRRLVSRSVLPELSRFIRTIAAGRASWPRAIALCYERGYRRTDGMRARALYAADDPSLLFSLVRTEFSRSFARSRT